MRYWAFRFQTTRRQIRSCLMNSGLKLAGAKIGIVVDLHNYVFVFASHKQNCLTLALQRLLNHRNTTYFT
jgi:hypothetical protein